MCLPVWEDPQVSTTTTTTTVEAGVPPIPPTSTLPPPPSLGATLPATGGTSDNTVTAAIGILFAGLFGTALTARRRGGAR